MALSPRGRIRLSDTLSRQLLGRVQIACTTDYLSPNVLHNQIIKTTLERLVKTDGIDAQFREGIADTVRGLSEIRSIPLTARDFGRVQLHGNNAAYGFLLRVCALAYEALLPESDTGRFRFRDVQSDPREMGLIFQDFVRNFFRLEQHQFVVKGEQVRWMVDDSVGLGHHFFARHVYRHFPCGWRAYNHRRMQMDTDNVAGRSRNKKTPL